ncbi:hypothetical protein HanRHA438_Chr01g0017261 [Helianthus annuus]|nr:hypothetical protein HanRHA438_Chr01g0017261 [Helianthus annuus]
MKTTHTLMDFGPNPLKTLDIYKDPKLFHPHSNPPPPIDLSALSLNSGDRSNSCRQTNTMQRPPSSSLFHTRPHPRPSLSPTLARLLPSRFSKRPTPLGGGGAGQ